MREQNPTSTFFLYEFPSSTHGSALERSKHPKAPQVRRKEEGRGNKATLLVASCCPVVARVIMIFVYL